MKVRIYQPHTDAGTHYTPGPDGIELQVSAQSAAFLKSLGKLERPGKPRRTDAAPAAAPPDPQPDPAAAPQAPGE